MRVDLRVIAEVLFFTFEEKGIYYTIKCRLDGGQRGAIVAYDSDSPLWAEFEEFNKQAFEKVGREECLAALYWAAEYFGRDIKR